MSDEAKDQLAENDLRKCLKAENAALTAEAIALREDKARLVEALEPFARFVCAWDERPRLGLAQKDADAVYSIYFSAEPQHILLGDLRAARAAIDIARKGGKG